MTTNNYSDFKNNDGNNNSKKVLPWLVAAIVGLAGTTGYFAVKNNSTGNQLQTSQVEIKKDEDLNVQLETQYKDAMGQLDEMKGKNVQLNDLIEKQKTELSTQKSKIGKLINVEKNLNGARAEMARMKATVQGYVDQIAKLEQDKQELGQKVTVLTTEKTSLQDNLSKERTEKDQIIVAKTAVEAEKAKVEQERAVFAKKTEIGSVVHVSNVKTTGYHVRASGKEKERTHAGNIDRLKWCFDAIENRVADAGTEKFYFRIIDPTGVAISTTGGGGGVIKLSDGKEIQYTCTKDVNFNGESENVCMSWDTKGNATLVKGKYTVEIYNKGYLAGTSTYDLK